MEVAAYENNTGALVPENGVWLSEAHLHAVDIKLRQGETFPVCRECQQAVAWRREIPPPGAARSWRALFG